MTCELHNSLTIPTITVIVAALPVFPALLAPRCLLLLKHCTSPHPPITRHR
jgi:hypothetical protein